MTVQVKEAMTLSAFESFIQQPENREKRFELINGEIIEVPSNPFVSVIASRIITFISLYLMGREMAGHVTGEGGGFVIDGRVFAPDVAYVRDLPTAQGYEQTPPLLAVEVISDPHSNTEQRDLRRKMPHYLRAGVVVWVVDYVASEVEIHIAGQPVAVYGKDDKLTCDILPDFELTVKDIFPKE
ncbi:MAG: Uma2 family endonuclease [Anaerolineaceae bacterium]|nr:MAG: Uma2 family endonuclease [Anaerolineaceae bacterium]